MKRESTTLERDAALHAKSRMERRSKRRIAKTIVARGLRRRRGLARAVLSGGVAAAIATMATLYEATL
ncbi:MULTISPECIES: hypothetical protein [unclassified Massilia]|uniref:hypothetical protein n=1 Tax=unclassified Massilia TaxID=2609279 RepID=UPI00177F10C1|nr:MULTISPECIES: hypothetical protein [unclassified Massilia]MBD8529929.1 hypothetical protein [Massilia sp. CFBP 13647]MBD8673874.1 hypothetical protein [Massilia sp. CFBP 13721]